MSLISTIVGLVADTHPMAPVPVVERLRAQLAEQEALLPARRASVSDANYTAEVLPSPENDAALSLAGAGLEQAEQRCERLRSALQVAIEKAAEAHAEDERRAHAKALRDLEAYATTFRRKAKALGARLQQAELAWTELLDAAQIVAKAIPRGSFGRNEADATGIPIGHFLGARQLGEAVPLEIARLVALRDPVGFARIGGGAGRFMGVKPDLTNSPRGGAGSMPSFEDKVASAVAHLLERARQAPVAPIAPPASVPVPQAPTDIDPEVLAELKAQHAADMAAIADTGPKTIEELREAWVALQDDAVDPPDGEELVALAAGFNAENSPVELVEEWQASQPSVGGTDDAE